MEVTFLDRKELYMLLMMMSITLKRGGLKIYTDVHGGTDERIVFEFIIPYPRDEFIQTLREALGEKKEGDGDG